MSARVHLRPGNVQPVWMGHPWIYAQAIERVEGDPGPGDGVTVLDPRGNVLGRGYWSPGSAIPVRMLTRDANVALDKRFLRDRIAEAAAWRREIAGLPNENHTGYRLVHADGDALSGLIVDVFGTSAVVQFGTIGMKRREADILDAVMSVARVERVYEVASERHQQHEGFTVTEGQVRGDASDTLSFRENGVSFRVPAPGAEGGGQKTGYYFDQRENRARVASLAKGRRVLDVFSYVGGFALAAARGGASAVVAIDSSAPALAAGERVAKDNGFDAVIRYVRGDARKTMDSLDARFDLVVLDPPKLAHHAREVDKALGLYRRLNATAARRVEPGGLLVTCSCSGSVSVDALLRAVTVGVRDANRDASILDVRGQAIDHPVPVAFPEGRYLKCVVARVR